MVTVQVSDFDIYKIASSGQCFRMSEKESRPIAGGTLKPIEVIALGKIVQVHQEGDRVSFSCSERDYEDIWRKYFDLDTNYTEIIQEIQRKYVGDQYLMKAVEYSRGIRILRQDFFEMLISFIISQRKSIPEIKKCIRALTNTCFATRGNLGLISNRGFVDGSFNFRFPSAKEIMESGLDKLKQCGVGYRDKYIIEASKWYSEFPGSWENELSGMGYERAMKTLMKIYGVGPKVANCVCLFGLHYMNACPIDVWIKKVIDQHYSGNIPEWFNDPNAGLIQQFVFFYERRAVPTHIDINDNAGEVAWGFL